MKMKDIRCSQTLGKQIFKIKGGKNEENKGTTGLQVR